MILADRDGESLTVQSDGKLAGQTVVVIGGSAGIGLETARQARAEGADVVLAGRSAERLEKAEREVGAKSSVALDAHDPASLSAFFDSLAGPLDHVMVTAGADLRIAIPI